MALALQKQFEQRRIVARAIAHKMTYVLGTRFPKSFPFLWVVGYPKTGTTWVCQMAGDYLQLPFPQFSVLPIGFPAVVHGHWPVSDRFRYCIYTCRDGRDALTSLYFFLIRRVPAGDHPRLTRRQRRIFPGLVNRDDVERNIGPFVEGQMKNPVATRVNWGDHVRSFFEASTPQRAMLRYEDLRRDPVSAFHTAMCTLTQDEADLEAIRTTVDKFSFERQTVRGAGSENRVRSNDPRFFAKGRSATGAITSHARQPRSSTTTVVMCSWKPAMQRIDHGCREHHRPPSARMTTHKAATRRIGQTSNRDTRGHDRSPPHASRCHRQTFTQ